MPEQQAGVSRQQLPGSVPAHLEPSAQQVVATHLSPRIAAVCLMYQLVETLQQPAGPVQADKCGEGNIAAAGHSLSPPLPACQSCHTLQDQLMLISFSSSTNQLRLQISSSWVRLCLHHIEAAAVVNCSP